jgi:hypothetical protein
METINRFSFNRFIQLSKQSLIINKKLIGITIAGFSGFVFLLLILFQFSNYSHWNNYNYSITFLVLFFLTGTIYSSLSFPAFRTKEKSISYLMQPATAAEKFLFEFLSRIVLFILLMPFVFWVVANIEGSVMHHFNPEFLNYRFSLNKILNFSTNNAGNSFFAVLAVIQGWLFVFIASFTGASHFSKSPLVKTLFTISIIVLGYALFIYLLVKGLNIKKYALDNDRLLFIHNKNEAIAFISLVITTINLSLLAIAYFRLKEREV